jgi:hypothetical protein
MHGLIGDRLLRRFARRILELSEVTAPPEADSDQAEGEAAGKSEDRSIYTPPEHPDGTVHKTNAEAEAAHHHERT